jgi:hypothetical protein
MVIGEEPRNEVRKPPEPGIEITAMPYSQVHAGRVFELILEVNETRVRLAIIEGRRTAVDEFERRGQMGLSEPVALELLRRLPDLPYLGFMVQILALIDTALARGLGHQVDAVLRLARPPKKTRYGTLLHQKLETQPLQALRA